MRKTIKATAMLALLATPAVAQDSVTGTVEHIYQTYTEQVPETKRVCTQVEVPVYATRQRQTNGGDVLGGMLIGGLLGKAITGDDKGAAAGAVFGGVAGAERNKTEQVVTGYRKERQCETVEEYRAVSRQAYDYSVITFKMNGTSYTLTFEK